MHGVDNVSADEGINRAFLTNNSGPIFLDSRLATLNSHRLVTLNSHDSRLSTLTDSRLSTLTTRDSQLSPTRDSQLSRLPTLNSRLIKYFNFF